MSYHSHTRLFGLGSIFLSLSLSLSRSLCVLSHHDCMRLVVWTVADVSSRHPTNCSHAVQESFERFKMLLFLPPVLEALLDTRAMDAGPKPLPPEELDSDRRT